MFMTLDMFNILLPEIVKVLTVFWALPFLQQSGTISLHHCDDEDKDM